MRMVRAADIVARLLLAGVVVATTLGLLAPYSVTADLANDFRPLLVVAALLAVAMSLLASAMWMRAACAAALGVNSMLALLALSDVAALQPAHAAAEQLRIVSFNVWTKNDRLDQTRQWLAASDADIIVLQEFNEHARQQVVKPLASLYPHVHDCRCNDIAILSRHPFAEAGGQGRTPEQPALSWLTLNVPGRGALRVVGLRTIYPYHPQAHVRHFDWLASSKLFDASGPSTALIGDFNATPWSFRFNRLARARGLKRHGTGIAASWPSGPLPLLLIDNVVTTPDIRSVSFSIGPDIGSDHRPVVATVALP